MEPTVIKPSQDAPGEPVVEADITPPVGELEPPAAPSTEPVEPAVPPTEAAQPGEITASRGEGLRGALGLGSETLQAAGVIRAHEAQAAQDTVLTGGGIMADTSNLPPVARERAEKMATSTPELVGK